MFDWSALSVKNPTVYPGMGMKLIQHGRRWHPRRERCCSRLGGSATANFRLKMPDARSKRSGSDDFVRPMLK